MNNQKSCIYCLEPISMGARKCKWCQSLQQEETVKSRLDLASIVISFVGVVAVMATLVGASFASLGFSSLRSIRDQSASVIKEMKTSYTQILLSESETLRDAVAVQTEERVIQIIDSMDLDAFDKTDKALPEVNLLSDRLSALGLLSGDTKKIDINLKAIASFLNHFSIGEYNSSLIDADMISDDVVLKYRLLFAAHSKLYEDMFRNNKGEEAHREAEEAIYPARKYYDLAYGSERISMIATIDYAQALIDEGSNIPQAESLAEAFPESSWSYYTEAMIAIKSDLNEKAISLLEKARQKGDLRTSDEVDVFKKDPRFKKLADIRPGDPLYSRYVSLTKP